MVSEAIRKLCPAHRRAWKEQEQSSWEWILTVAVSLDCIRELCFRSWQSHSRELLPAVLPCLSICTRWCVCTKAQEKKNGVMALNKELPIGTFINEAPACSSVSRTISIWLNRTLNETCATEKILTEPSLLLGNVMCISQMWNLSTSLLTHSK